MPGDALPGVEDSVDSDCVPEPVPNLASAGVLGLPGLTFGTFPPGPEAPGSLGFLGTTLAAIGLMLLSLIDEDFSAMPCLPHERG